MSRFALFLLLLASCFGLTSCGGGGGGSSTIVNVVGQILWIETGSGTNPASTVRIGDVAAQTALSDGFFSMNVPTGATSLTVTFTPTGGSPIVRVFTFPAVTADTDLGELYIGPSEVTIVGRLLDSTNSNPVNAAIAKIAGRSAVSGTDGRFAITGVAYSSTTQSVFFGLQGVATKATYFPGFFSPPSAAIGGVVDVGDVAMIPEGDNNPPPLPFNMTGVVSPNGFNATVEILSGPTVIRTGTADGFGKFTFWLPAGSYTVRATKGAQSGQSSFTVTNVNQVVTANVTLN
ncbi:carboxypeptidase-like regulatory domain-containing protein [Kamptonema cortianum]|nr:carboxypeptidase-like regulatory domain-containing protein [Geitlerinema splendidum]MDK3156977.1 carboxypeptidase-like regulatory domain-containing protein [Kamptonema cortianum]